MGIPAFVVDVDEPHAAFAHAPRPEGRPRAQLARPPVIPEPVDMTTTAGKAPVSAPMPYVTDDPMLGRPGCEKPVLKKICAGAWLNWSVWTDLTKQASSTTLPRCGRTSASSAPHCPCLTNLKRGPSAAASERMTAYPCPPIT